MDVRDALPDALSPAGRTRTCPVDPGRDMVAGTADDLPTDQVIAGLASHNITLLMEAFADPTLDVLPCYRELVAPTDGLAVPSGNAATLAQRIIDASRASSTRINRVDLRVSAGCALGVTFSPAPPTDR